MTGNAAAVLTKPAFRKIEWLARDIAVERRPDGVIVLKSRIPLKPYEKHIPASLAKWAREQPNRIWLAQRIGADRQWRKLSYGEAKRTVDALTQGILNLKLEPGRPVAILSGKPNFFAETKLRKLDGSVFDVEFTVCFPPEGAAASIDWAFATLGWTEVIHCIAPENLASQAVARKLGSGHRGRGLLPPPYEESRVDIWAQTRAQWFARSADGPDASTARTRGDD